MIIIEPTAVQPFASVTVTLYVAALKLVAVGVVCPLFQRYVYAPVPPLGVAVAVPFAPPLQDTFVPVTVTVTPVAGWVIMALEVVVQPFASVTVTVYVPALRPVGV